MKCVICGKKAESYSIIDGRYYPCGHTSMSHEQAKINRRILAGINADIEKERRQ
jgi:hypothetical protein